MSQNQSYFWQTTRYNVFLKRSAKYHLMMALMVVLTFSTVCLAELEHKSDIDDGVLQTEEETKMSIYPAENALKPNINEQNVGDSPIEHKIETPSTKVTTSSSNLGFIHAFIASISVILVSELGDKTFFIAAIMAMRHARLTVFVGAIAALGLMTVLSAVFGMAATIIPRVYTYYISTALFAIFGLKMLKEGYHMKATDAQEELEEVQTDLRKREDERKRKMHGGYEETDVTKSKRKNSNTAINSDAIGNRLASNSDMYHRQRKQAANNNNNETESEESDENSTQRRAILLTPTTAVINNLKDESSSPKILTLNGSPSLSTSKVLKTAEMNHCDIKPSGDGKVLSGDEKVEPSTSKIVINSAVHSITSRSLVDLNATNSINNKSFGNTTTSGLSNGKISNDVNTNETELKQLGNKKRLDREVSSTLVQDPESGVIRKNAKRSGAYMASRIFMQAFTMTFLAEWGDRSQLTTIILSAREDVYGVIVGGILGHSMCTGLAVIGGRMIAQKISVKTVTIVGGIVFILFAITSLFMKPNED